MNTIASRDLADPTHFNPQSSVQDNSRTILVVYDHEGILFAGIRGQAEYNVNLFLRAHLTFSYLCAASEASLIISDMPMPWMDGWRMAFCARRRNVNLPIPFITTHDEHQLDVHLLCEKQCGARIVWKPFAILAPLNRVSELMSGPRIGCHIGTCPRHGKRHLSSARKPAGGSST